MDARCREVEGDKDKQYFLVRTLEPITISMIDFLVVVRINHKL